MQITFDPHNVQECATIARLLGTTAQPDTAPAAQPETPRADGLTVNDGPTPTFEPSQMAPLAEGKPQYIQGEVTPEHPTGDTDCHGMVHDDTIHSTPASKNADGSWRAKRGQKEAYEAAIAAATPTPTPTPTPAPASMPMPQPASAAPATPPAPIDYKTMAERFMAKMADPDGLPPNTRRSMRPCLLAMTIWKPTRPASPGSQLIWTRWTTAMTMTDASGTP